MTITIALSIGLGLMSAVALAAIAYGFKLTNEMNSESYQREKAYEYLKAQRQNSGNY